jgi:hypothetical protein
MSEDLLLDLKNLKSKLFEMESTYEDKVKTLEKRNKTLENINKKLDNLVTLQSDIIQIECDGKIYETSKTTIRNCILDNILKYKIYSNYSNDSYYIDLSRKGLKLVLKIMRFYSFEENKNRIYDIYVKDNSEEIIREQLNYFFKNESRLYNLIKFIN